MNFEDLEHRLTIIFRDVLDNESIVLARETTAADIDAWDSLAQISLLVAIEKDFRIHFSLPEVESLRNVGDMMDLIVKKI